MILQPAYPLARPVRWPGLPVALSLALFMVILGWAFWPGLFTSADPLLADPTQTLQGPSAQHWFGTDHLGRDLYARCVHGASLSLQATGIAVLVALVAGSLLGGIAGWLGGVADRALAIVVEVLMAIPGLLLAMAIVTALGFGTLEIALAVGLSSVAIFARLARGEVLRWRTRTFVEAAQVAGVGTWTNLCRHVLPN
ncbi:MAG TPA: ABC transporter permease, partial [Pseudomonas sp.]|uniref:ABC transporter permease n=1 Tax=Pseudomonas sp. TaxID=306 RepID=UPI002B467A3F